MEASNISAAEKAFNKDLESACGYDLKETDLYPYSLGYIQGAIEAGAPYIKRIDDLISEIKRLKDQRAAIVEDRDKNEKEVEPNY